VAVQVIVFRHADPRFPFLWSTADQPPARWHGKGEGPAHYFAETPDAAWAEFLRHEEITEPDDVLTIARALWAVELPEVPATVPELPRATLVGGRDRYAACQREARRLRAAGATGLMAPSAAVRAGTRSGFTAGRTLQPGPTREERVFVLFGPRPDLVGWAACAAGRPRPDLLRRVHRLAR